MLSSFNSKLWKTPDAITILQLIIPLYMANLVCFLSPGSATGSVMYEIE